MADGDKTSQKDKIEFLFKEYGTLRTEIISRTGYGFQSGAVLAAVGTWLLQQPSDSWYNWAFVAGIVILGSVGFIFLRVNVRDIWKAAHRIKELEHEINSRAGEHLLVWERLYGAARMSFLAGLFSRIEPLPRSSLPPLDSKYLA